MNALISVNPISKIVLFVFVFLAMFGCEQEKQPWNPIFEETNFSFINDQIERSLVLLDDVYTDAAVNQQSAIQEKLQQTKALLLQLKNYYLPLTTVRQKIYDAERFYKIGNMTKTRKLLEDSKVIVASLDGATPNEAFDKVTLKIISMINDVIASLDGNSASATYEKMKQLGEHINLKLIKGELVLSEISFDK